MVTRRRPKAGPSAEPMPRYSRLMMGFAKSSAHPTAFPAPRPSDGRLGRKIPSGPKTFDQPQQHPRPGVGVGQFDMLVRMMADAAAATHEQHCDVVDVDHRPDVVTRPAW